MSSKTKRLRTVFRVVLIIALLPWAFTLITSIFNMFFGFTWGIFTAAYTWYGAEAFVKTALILIMLFYPISIISGILIIVSLIVLIKIRREQRKTEKSVIKKLKYPASFVKAVKIIIIISVIPWLLTTIISFYCILAGADNGNEKIYGIAAFIFSWGTALERGMSVYIISAILILIGFGFLIGIKQKKIDIIIPSEGTEVPPSEAL